MGGIINTWNIEKQFGFVSCDSKRPDLFVHAEYFTDLDQRYEAKNKGLRRGDKISFEVKEPIGGKKSAEAMHVEMVKKSEGSRSRSRSRTARRAPSTKPKKIEVRLGDWDCPKCADHQFARNMECRKCGTPKPLDSRRSRSRKRSPKRSRSRSRRNRSPSRKRSSSGRKSRSRRRSSIRKKSRSKKRSASRKRSSSRKRSASKKRSVSKKRKRSKKRSSKKQKKQKCKNRPSQSSGS